MKKVLYILLFFSFTVQAQFNQYGYPFVRNYLNKEIRTQYPNFCITKDSKGVMYFGTSQKGVVYFNGNYWKNIAVSNHSVCRSLDVDTNDIIYVGAVGEFGYIAPNARGNLKYHSLVSLLDTTKIKFTNVWKTYVTNKGTYFCALSHIFHYQFPNKLKVIELPEGSFFSFKVGNKILVGNYKLGLLELKGEKVEVLKGIEELIDQDILQILPFKVNSWLIITYNGLFQYDFIAKKINKLGDDDPLVKKSNDYLANSQVYNGVVIPEKGFAFATLGQGIYFSDKRGRFKEHLSSQNVLINSMISDLYYNSQLGVLWATSEKGITSIEYDSPFRIFNKESNLNSTALSVIRHNGILYVGTYEGLYYLTFDEDETPKFVNIPQIKGSSQMVYSLNQIETDNGETKLLASTSEDIFEIQGYNAYPLNFREISSFCALSYKHTKNTAFIGSSRGLKKIQYINGKWITKDLQNTKDDIFSIVEDSIGNIWGATAINGIIRITPDEKLTTFSTIDGLPTNTDLKMTTLNNKIYVCSRNGFYCFNPLKNKFEASNPFGIHNNSGSHFISNAGKGYLNSYWVVVNDRIQKITNHYNQNVYDTTSFKRLPEMSVENFYTESNGITWFATSEGLISYDNLYKTNKSSSYYSLFNEIKLSSTDSSIFNGTFISRLILGNDTLIYPKLTQPENENQIIDFSDNNVTFIFSSPFFKDLSSVTYSYFLEGFDKTWSKWSSENKAVFTNLSEGDYTFKVKAKNVFEEESTISTYTFTILPPWYRTYWAYGGYFIIGILILVFAVKLYTRKLEADKKRLEGIVAERTAEVVKQKDEILEKNEEIEHKNKDITDSIVYAKRIQEALLPVKELIQIPTIDFFVYFRPKDIVSGDFYFIRQLPKSDMLIAAAADCTGHGVPGAFMSMLGMSFLNELIVKPEIQHSNDLLDHLREHVITSLNPKGKETETKDGMDIALIAYNYKTNQLDFSGGNNPMYLIRNGELHEYKADKMPIGLHDRRNEPFNRHEVVPENGDVIYLFSDGFPDQFGGEKGKKYMSKNLKEFLTSISHLPMQEQEKRIAEESTAWRGPIEQIDDQIIMGIRFNLQS